MLLPQADLPIAFNLLTTTLVRLLFDLILLLPCYFFFFLYIHTAVFLAPRDVRAAVNTKQTHIRTEMMADTQAPGSPQPRHRSN